MPATLRPGSRGPEVVRLQQLLNQKVRPSPHLATDGVFGPRTEAAVRTFQSQNHLQVDGIVGPHTWAALERSGSGGPPPPPPHGGGTGTQHINQEGLNLVMEFEGLRLTAYQDSVGVWTIGWGHTGPDVHRGLTITRARAEALLRQDLNRFEDGVRRLVRVPLTSNQFSALVSFSFNVGLHNLETSTLLRLLNQGDYRGAADQFPRWNRAGGQVLPGLVRRRAAERALFLKP